jgi:hypothetical protein
MDLSNPKTWTDGARVVIDAPHIVGPLVVAFIVGTWWLRGFLAKERIGALEERLRLAKDRLDDTAEKLNSAKAEQALLQTQINAHETPAKIASTATSIASYKRQPLLQPKHKALWRTGIRQSGTRQSGDRALRTCPIPLFGTVSYPFAGTRK